ncbi:MAG: transcription antitermination factor NusB [bacterium]
MGIRRQARESALQMLYQLDVGGQASRDVVKTFWQANDTASDVKEFANRIFVGVSSELGAIDETIAAHSLNWKISRMAAVDKNILRMAVFELTRCPDIPVKVTINEAVEIAKRFGSAESGAFVNGILDNIAKGVEKDVAIEGEADV